jgi:hypothetical protein
LNSDGLPYFGGGDGADAAKVMVAVGGVKEKIFDSEDAEFF